MRRNQTLFSRYDLILVSTGSWLLHILYTASLASPIPTTAVNYIHTYPGSSRSRGCTAPQLGSEVVQLPL